MKGFKQYKKKWIKGENPRTGKKRKRNPTGGMDVCLL
jgi:hypothetical protein